MTFLILRDAYFLERAIHVAVDGLNNLGLAYGAQVGALIVSPDDEILSRSHNAIHAGERRHAEEIALINASDHNLDGATLYVTIEPCNGNPFHTRKHCCEQIAESGLSRVVAGVPKRKYEGGADYLRSQGIAVDFLENLRLKRLCELVSVSGRASSINLMLTLLLFTNYFSLLLFNQNFL